jgi:hypothetical protein
MFENSLPEGGFFKLYTVIFNVPPGPMPPLPIDDVPFTRSLVVPYVVDMDENVIVCGVPPFYLL